VVIRRGEVWWAELPEPVRSGPGYRRPVVVVSSNEFNDSLIRTVIAVVVTSNVGLAGAPGNVLLSRKESGLRKNSVANVSQVLTFDKSLLTDRVRMVSPRVMDRIDAGLKLVLSL
jgi:mRNA interferase MazF